MVNTTETTLPDLKNSFLRIMINFKMIETQKIFEKHGKRFKKITE